MDYKKTNDKNQSQGKIFSLETHWNSCVAAVSDGKWLKPLTQKDRGQLKAIANKIGANTKPVISCVVKSWCTFVERAAIAKGLSICPEQPDIGFLLKYCDVAVDLWQSIAEQNAPLTSETTTLPKVANKVVRTEPAQVSVDEILSCASEKKDKGEPSTIGGQSVLDPREHARLIADIDHIAKVAGIQVRFIHQSMVGVCGQGEIRWVKSFLHYR